jgi:hypothetical protein
VGVTELIPEPLPDEDEGPISAGSLSVLSGGAVTLWGLPGSDPDTQPEPELQLSPDRPVIIGRFEGREVPYLDPAYRPTTVMPGTGQSILRSGGQGQDISVSRGHFMLRATTGGILFVNGVPRRGGGVRPPLNGTWLLVPVQRALSPAEEYLIEHGSVIVVKLPNGTQVQIECR